MNFTKQHSKFGFKSPKPYFKPLTGGTQGVNRPHQTETADQGTPLTVRNLDDGEVTGDEEGTTMSVSTSHIE